MMILGSKNSTDLNYLIVCMNVMQLGIMMKEVDILIGNIEIGIHHLIKIK